MTPDTILTYLNEGLLKAQEWFVSPAFYIQVLLIVATLLAGYFAARALRTRVSFFRLPPASGPLLTLRKAVYGAADLLFPLAIVLGLELTDSLGSALVGASWLIRIAQSLALVFLLYSFITRFIQSPAISSIAKWVAIPVATLHVFGWLDDVTAFLDSMALELGNIRVSAYSLIRLLIFGSILFWLGRLSTSHGQQVIRKQEAFDIGTREVFAKLFQVAVTFAVLLLLLQIMGIDLTTLAVFGGAIGVGLGFGLQAIASNFISGIIILLDRSVLVGDYVELEDGKAGTVRELNMRSTTIETFDGKDIVVPNEQFITHSFRNWTHKNKYQRYSLEVPVAYSTDLHKLFEILRSVVAAHPQVISGPEIPDEEQPDAAIERFGESAIHIQIEYWMEGVDDGANSVGADLMLMIWDAFKEHGIELAFPKSEATVAVRVDTNGEA